MAVNVSDISYDVDLMTEGGASIPLSNLVTALSWESQVSELAARATLTVANIKINGAWLMEIAKINCVIVIYASIGKARKKVFDGTIWEWQYTSAQQKELTITAYDRLIRLQQSKDFLYFQKGMSTQALISEICAGWGVPVAYSWGASITHEKKTFSGQTISDMIISLLEEVKQKTGQKYIAAFNDGQFEIKGYGANSDIYKFETDSTISTSDRLSINNLVTRVKIIGKVDKSGRPSVDAIVDGDTRYGVLQEIIRRDSDKTVGSAQAEANALIKDKGKPEETIQVQAPDLPYLKKGDKVEIRAGNLLGYFNLEGVVHNGMTRQMTMTLSRGD